MSEINYQALREAAEKATWGDWDSYKPHRGARGYEVRLSSQAIAQHVLKNNAEFIAAFNPKVALALLDEREKNQQYIKLRDQENEDIALTVGKLRVELEAAENNLIDSECHVAELEEALRDKQALLEASEKRIAELEAEPVSQAYKLNALDGNSPVTPDGWVMVPKELTPEMMRAVQIRSELGGYATSNLSGAYNMFSEFWNVSVSAAPKVDDL
ncbi:ead/Ea22-like family protein [Escherichia coli]|nr:ead/Ea22-like family protein [Escherichia coli]